MDWLFVIYAVGIVVSWWLLVKAWLISFEDVWLSDALLFVVMSFAWTGFLVYPLKLISSFRRGKPPIVIARRRVRGGKPR